MPDDIPTLEALISDHQEFMENTARRQPEVDSVLKARQQPPAATKSEPQRRGSGKKLSATS